MPERKVEIRGRRGAFARGLTFLGGGYKIAAHEQRVFLLLVSQRGQPEES